MDKSERKQKEADQMGCLVFSVIGVMGLLMVYGWWSRESNAPPRREPTRFESQFSGWDGSHTQFKRAVIEGLKDPESFEHIETRWDKLGEHVRISMKYRARNSFGGMVIEEATGRVNYRTGKVIAIDSVR